MSCKLTHLALAFLLWLGFRLEAMDSIEEQELLQNASAEDLAELEAQVKHWEARFRVAVNRHRMLCEDVRQVQVQQHLLRSQQYRLVNERGAADTEELNLRQAFESLSHALTAQQERQRKLLIAQADTNRAAARANEEAQELAMQLIDAGGRAGELTALALAKIKERMLVVQQVQAIKNELKQVVDVELSSSAAVSALSTERSQLSHAVDTLSRSATGLSFAIEQLRSEMGHLDERAAATRDSIAAEESRLADMERAFQEKQAVKARMQEELQSIQSACEIDEAHVREAERKLARALEAAESLTDSVRQATVENQRLSKELRMLSAHGAQLESDVQLRTDDIAQHDTRVAERKQALEAELLRQEESILSSGKRSVEMQEATVAAKQRIMDIAVALQKTELSTEEVEAQRQAQEALVESLATAAAEKRAARQALEGDLVRLTELRATGRSAIDLAHAQHAKRMAAFESDIRDVQRQTDEVQDHTRLLQQRMVAASNERNATRSANERALTALADQTAEAEQQTQQCMQDQMDWIANSQREHAKLHEAIRVANAKLTAARERRAALDARRIAAEKKRTQERATLTELESQLEKAQRSNAMQSGVVGALSQQVSTAASLHAAHVHDNQTLHHMLEYTRQTNAALTQRKQTAERKALARTSTAQVAAQTPQAQ